MARNRSLRGKKRNDDGDYEKRMRRDEDAAGARSDEEVFSGDDVPGPLTIIPSETERGTQAVFFEDTFSD